jgi:hypothetical protein
MRGNTTDDEAHEATPQRRKFSFLKQFFEVAALPEPYYNPANLEKAATRVKQKEFIQNIGISHGGCDAA